MASQEEAASAMEALNGEVFPALESLQPARPSPAVPPQAFSSAALRVKYAGDGRQPSDNLYISGLPSPAPEAARLRRVFEGLGLTVVRAKVIPDTRGSGSSAAMVQMASQEQADAAMALLHC
uniref:RRM domain-containing protein n=1 Tax=Alexandrium catenella TaxID=2925 RepID=A0A7S1LJJ4_ALECA